MSLTKTKQITLHGQSKAIVDGQEVIAMNFSAQIVEGTTTSTSANVANKAAYNDNIVKCREDEDSFREWVREVEDAMKAETAE